MCNLSDGIELAAIERTTKKITKEVTKKKNKVAINVLMKNFGLSALQSMDMLELSQEERNELINEF